MSLKLQIVIVSNPICALIKWAEVRNYWVDITDILYFTRVMSAIGNTAEDVLKALRELPEEEKESFLSSLAKDEELLKDLLDSALIESRRHEPSRPLEDILKN